VTWRPNQLRAACGLIGPIAFTTAWAVSGRRQEIYSVRHEHISGLAAPDARHPHLMTAGFLTLGTCAIVFARELRGWLGGRAAGPGPALLGLAGAATISAGLLRRDRMSNTPPPGLEGVPQSRRNDGHDVSSVVAQTASILAMLLLARRSSRDPDLAGLARWAVGGALVGGATMGYFATETARPGNGIIQRVGVSIPLAFMAGTALRMLAARRDRIAG
jgi:hypothetical protein